MAFLRVFSGSPYEAKIGFCRAIRFGQQIHVAGTAPLTADGEVHAVGDALAQARRCLEIALQAVAELGGQTDQVYRVRWYLTDIGHQHQVSAAHAEVFHQHPPVATMLEVKGLVDSQMLVELELEAFAETGPAAPTQLLSAS